MGTINTNRTRKSTLPKWRAIWECDFNVLWEKMIKKLTKVESSMVYAVGYDRETKTLEVVFTRGGIWKYVDVPEREYRDMMKSNSIGSYMRNCIIDEY